MYRHFCFFKLFPMVGKGLIHTYRIHLPSKAHESHNRKSVSVEAVDCFLSAASSFHMTINNPFTSSIPKRNIFLLYSCRVSAGYLVSSRPYTHLQHGSLTVSAGEEFPVPTLQAIDAGEERGLPWLPATNSSTSSPHLR